jgi:hypothetical protein
MTSQFGVCYDPATNLVTQIVRIDCSDTDSEDNVRRGLLEHCPPGHKMIFIPEHQIENTEVILAGLGVALQVVTLDT